MEATISPVDTGQAQKQTTKDYKSPGHALIWFFRKSRDLWKSKYQELKGSVKQLKNWVADLTKSRELWKLLGLCFSSRVGNTTFLRIPYNLFADCGILSSMSTQKMNQIRSKVDEWVEGAANGDEAARQRLLGFCRPILRRMVAGRLDKRLAARVDPSDVVQETMIDADRKLARFLRQPTVPLLVWLRKIAAERVIDSHRLHLGSQCRSVIREYRESQPFDGSPPELIELIAKGTTSPSGELMREEEIERVRAAVDGLPERYREVLVMRHFDQMEPDEIAQVLGISPGAVRARIFRALLRLRETLETHP